MIDEESLKKYNISKFHEKRIELNHERNRRYHWDDVREVSLKDILDKVEEFFHKDSGAKDIRVSVIPYFDDEDNYGIDSMNIAADLPLSEDQLQVLLATAQDREKQDIINKRLDEKRQEEHERKELKRLLEKYNTL